MTKIVSPLNPGKSGNQYIVDVISSKIATSVSIRDSRVVPIIKHIEAWAGSNLSDVFLSGSSAKGTALKGSSDIDLFVSLKVSTPGTLNEIFDSLTAKFKALKIVVRPQNVSIRITYFGLQMDLVPGKKLPNQVNWHYLYTNRRENQYRIQTNVSHHVNFVLNSNRINEIIALKIWRDINKLELPSMYLEMYVIKALYAKISGKIYLESNFLHVLEHIAKYFGSTAIYDPSIDSNVISNTLDKNQKNAIQRAAIKSLDKDYLNQIIY